MDELGFYVNAMVNIYIFIVIASDEPILDAKHLRGMWTRPRRVAEQRRRQPIVFSVCLRDVGHVSQWR